ncbi:MAG: YchF/TatD family DNA exonuclease [Nitrospirae bacterium]|nr:YchF/TatD family DNA exonuclease [Nitrospirota bacterium]
MLIDSHCHLDFGKFDGDRDGVISRAREEGIAFIINVGTSLERSKKSVELAEKHDFIYAAVGIHPHEAGKVKEDDYRILEKLAENGKVVAIGETGLDYYRNPAPKDKQKENFRRQIALAKKLRLPLIVHNREADGDTLSILKEEKAEKVKGILHCFSGSRVLAQECLELGFYISVAGQITYPNAESLREVVKDLPTDRLLVETDSPFLAPQPQRGKRNEPAFVKYVAEELARLHNLSREDICRITTLNTKYLLGIGERKEKSKIAYPIRDSLYLNITNRCTNNCTFCVRDFTDFVRGHNLKMEQEPAAEEIIQALGNPQGYKEVVFCGYGEPLLRLDTILEVSRYLKKEGVLVRIVTNGQGNLIHGKNIVPELAGLIEAVSVSLNAENGSKYFSLCHPEFGKNTYEKVKEFVRECKKYIPRVEVTVLDMEGVDVTRCEKIAREELGVEFRLRRYNHPG